MNITKTTLHHKKPFHSQIQFIHGTEDHLDDPNIEYPLTQSFNPVEMAHFAPVASSV